MPSSRRGLKAALVFIGLVIAVVAVYAVLLYGSVQRLGATAVLLDDASADLELSVANEDLPGMLDAIDAVGLGVDELALELGRWEWTVASYVPVYGGDVAIARQLLDIAGSFMAHAVDPVTGVLDKVLGLPEGFEGLAQGVPLVDEAVVAVEGALDEVTRASVALDMIGTPHTAELSAAVVQLRDLLAELEAALAKIEPYLGAYDSLKGLLGSLGL